MTKRITSVLTILATLATMGLANVATVTSAHATDGRNAIGMCIDRGPQACTVAYHPGGTIDILVTNDGVDSVIHCPSFTSECSVDKPPTRVTPPPNPRGDLVGPTTGLTNSQGPKQPVGPVRAPRGGFEVGRALN